MQRMLGVMLPVRSCSIWDHAPFGVLLGVNSQGHRPSYSTYAYRSLHCSAGNMHIHSTCTHLNGLFTGIFQVNRPARFRCSRVLYAAVRRLLLYVIYTFSIFLCSHDPTTMLIRLPDPRFSLFRTRKTDPNTHFCNSIYKPPITENIALTDITLHLTPSRRDHKPL